MGGLGSRFTDAGYTTQKSQLPVMDRHSKTEKPMIICAMKDIPGIYDEGNTVICVNRPIHAKDGTQAAITAEFPKTIFIHDHVLLDQAFACFLAREYLSKDEELFVACCDNGMIFDHDNFIKQKHGVDCVVLSHCGDLNIEKNPNAHSWLELENNSKLVKNVSIKKILSDQFMHDHATTGSFWFSSASKFLEALEILLSSSQSISTKRWIDEVLDVLISQKNKVTYFDVEYLCWGTPEDYETYQASFRYWKGYLDANRWLKK